MTEYKDNESYERDKADLIRIAEGSAIVNFIENRDVVANLLRQSKWIGADSNESKPTRHIPVIRDKSGKLIKDYSLRDHIAALTEEFCEVLNAACVEDKSALAEEIQDLKTVCETWQHALGFNDNDIDELASGLVNLIRQNPQLIDFIMKNNF